MALQFTNLTSIVDNNEREERTPNQTEEGSSETSNLLQEVIGPEPVVEDLEMPEQLRPDEVVSAEDIAGGVEVPLTPSEERKARIEEEVGETINEVGASAAGLAATLGDGVICQVHIKRERFQTKTTAAEMGVSQGVAAQVLSGLGSKLLAPKTILGQMNSADTMARNLLARFGLKTPWGRFIPTSNWQVFKSAFMVQRNNYFAALNTLTEMMEDGSHETWVVRQYTEFAYDRWKYVRESYTEDDSSVDHTGTSFATMVNPPPGFISSVVEAALARVPSVDVVRSGAEFSYELNLIEWPATMLAKDCAIRDQELRSEVCEHYNQRHEHFIDRFLSAAHEGLVEQMNSLVLSIGKTLNNKATVHGKTINRILSALSEMRTLNVTNNRDFEERVTALEQYVESKKDTARSSGPISSKEVLSRLRATANSISEALNRDLHSSDQFSNLGA